jgi:hypothetical protein
MVSLVFLLDYAFNLIGSENDFEIMKSIEQYFNYPMNEMTIEGIADLKVNQD